MSNRANRAIRLMLFVSILSMLPAAAGAKTIYVDDDGQADFRRIQAAIDAAGPGDIVSVAPGTYYENVALKDGVNVIGSGVEVTIIDANGYGDVVDARANDAAIAGFTLKNGGQSGFAHMNCGVYVEGSYAPVVKNNLIVGNQIGIGAWYGAHPDVRNNIIEDNATGLYLYGSPASPTDPHITNNTIVGNWTDGIVLRETVSPVITNNIIVGHGTGINRNYVSGTPILGYNNLWDNDVNYLHDGGVDDTLAGPGSMSVDPCFARPGYWADANDPNVPLVDRSGRNALWVAGDYHLKSQAGRYDPNSQMWVLDDLTSPCIDAGDPNSPVGFEPVPNGGIINLGAYGGTTKASKSLVPQTIVYIQWLGHSSVKLWAEGCIVYIDPQRLSISPHDATLVLVTHSHGDHYSPADIARVANAQTQFVAPPDVTALYGKGQAIAPGQIIESYCARLIGVAAYNTNKTNHPKTRNWVGYVIELGGRRIYVAGDTDLIDEMKSLGDIDAAILPAGGTYTMNAVEAAQATAYIKPDLAIPYHWGQNVGTIADAQTFAQLARCAVRIMTAGETISSDNWPVYSPLVAHWKLDEAAGSVADDSEGDFNGTLYGGPAWLPSGGMVGGALQLDGVDDYVATPFVLNPNKGPFSVYAWVKGGAAGQVIVSQKDGPGTGAAWLGAAPLQGRLMTALVPPAAGRSVPQPLISGYVVADGQWHHVGLVWDGSLRQLYADGAEVAKDAAALSPLQSCDGGLHLGAGKGLGAGTFWMGLLDDVRICNVALSPTELAQITR